MQNVQRVIHLVFLFCAFLTWLVLREVLSLLFNRTGLLNVDWVLPPADLGGLLVGGILFFILTRLGKVKQFLEEALAELARVTWPNRKETVMSTGIVAVLVSIASLLVLLFDSVWGWFVEKFLY